MRTTLVHIIPGDPHPLWARGSQKFAKALSCKAIVLVAALAMVGTLLPVWAQAQTFLPEIVDSGGNVGQHTSVAVDLIGRTHVSYYDNTNGNLKWARKNPFDWTIETVDSAGDVGKYSSIAVDSIGRPHISYHDATNGDLKYATRDIDTAGNPVWTVETVDEGGIFGSDLGLFTSIALDITNNAYISYYDNQNEFLKLAFQEALDPLDPEKFTIEMCCDARVLDSTSIDLDARVNPIIAYFDLNDRNLKLALFDRAQVFSFPIVNNPIPRWGIEIVPTGGAGLFFEGVSLVLDNGGPHLSYVDNAVFTSGVFINVLMYAEKPCATVNCQQPTATQPTGPGTWSFETVADTFIAAFDGFTDIALDPTTGIPHISYYSSLPAVKHAARNGTPWNTEIVDSDGNVGQYNSISIGPDGDLHISYYDATNGNLKHAESNTPVGSNVVVQIGDDQLTFDTVTAAGQTTISESSAGTAPPANFQQACTPPQYFAIATTATFSGNIEICLSYDDTVCDETSLSLLHLEGGTFVDVTTSIDPAANIICGTVTALSEFLLAIPEPVQVPDLIVESLTHSPANPTTVDTITFTAVVKNVGNAPAGASTLNFRVGGETFGQNFAIPALGPGASSAVQRQEVLTVAQNYQNTATADINDVVTELDEGNNQRTDFYTVTIAGDLTGDGVVNFDDLNIVVGCFGQNPADNPACASADLNGDGVVNILDVSIVISNFSTP